MLTTETAGWVANFLRQCFAEVVIDGSRERIVVRARGHNRMPHYHGCRHEYITTVKDVWVIVNSDGYLCNDKQRDPVHCSRVTFCSRCDKLMGATV